MNGSADLGMKATPESLYGFVGPALAGGEFRLEGDPTQYRACGTVGGLLAAGDIPEGTEQPLDVGFMRILALAGHGPTVAGADR